MIIPRNLFVVLVLYKSKLSESISYKSLMRIFTPESFVQILIYDNSPENFEQEMVPSGLNYIRDVHNSGLAMAYNVALNKAKNTHCSWLLLLDQDSCLENSLFEEFSRVESKLHSIAVLIPHVRSYDGRSISPRFENGKVNVYDGFHKKLNCINSMSFVNVFFAINVMKGFDKDFPLDMLDYRTCHFVNESNFGYWVLGCNMYHSLSVMSSTYVSLERYKSIVSSEFRFYRTIGEEYKYILHLFLRSLKQLMHLKFDYVWINVKYLLWCK